MANILHPVLATLGLSLAVTTSALAVTPNLSLSPLRGNAQCDCGDDKKEETKSVAEPQCGDDKKKEETKSVAEPQCGDDKKKEETKSVAEPLRD